MDYWLEQAINGPAGAHPVWDAIMRDAATWAVPVFAGIVVVWFAIGLLRDSLDDRRGALTALLAAGGALLVNQGVLLFWSRPRPFQAHPDGVHTLVARSADGSFPSDHAAAAVVIAAVLFITHRRLGAIALLVAGLVCLARVYVGAHYPGDVLAGAAVGVGVAWLACGPLRPITEGVTSAVDWTLARLRVRFPKRVAGPDPP